MASDAPAPTPPTAPAPADDGDTIRAGVGRRALAYCAPASAVAGEAVAIHASAPGGTVDVEVVRDGAEPEVVWRAEGVATAVAALPADAPERGCGWPAVASVPVGDGWRPGLYLVRLRRPGAGAADPPTAWFVVRSAAPRPGRAVLALATNTWNAYNDAGGRNLYTGAVAVSSARPLALGMLAKPAGPGERVVHGVGPYARYTGDNGLGLWHGMAGWAGQERRFAVWAEQRGIELDYATNADVERVPGLLDGASLLLSVGHDEYWSWGMRDAVEGFADGGGNVAFLSGNACYWQVRLEGDVMVAWKHRFAEDPVHGTDRAHLTTTMWADPLLDRPEAALTGVSFTRGGYARTARSVPGGSGGYEVHRPGHWLLEGTGLARGDVLGGEVIVVGYECDGCDLELRHGLPAATGVGGTPAGFEVVATAPATPFDAETTPLPLPPGGEYELEFHARRLLADASPAAQDRLRAGHAVLGAHRRSGGAGGTVVTTGCTEWAYGLGDPAVATVTATILRTLAPSATG
jgi:hypothetical protein